MRRDWRGGVVVEVDGPYHAGVGGSIFGLVLVSGRICATVTTLPRSNGITLERLQADPAFRIPPVAGSSGRVCLSSINVSLYLVVLFLRDFPVGIASIQYFTGCFPMFSPAVISREPANTANQQQNQDDQKQCRKYPHESETVHAPVIRVLCMLLVRLSSMITARLVPAPNFDNHGLRMIPVAAMKPPQGRNVGATSSSDLAMVPPLGQ